MNKIISQLRAYRDISHMTQQDLAERIGVSKRTIVALEKHGCSPSLIIAYKIAKIFHCAIEDLFIYKTK